MFIPLRRFLGSFILTAIGLILTTSNLVAAPIEISTGFDNFRTGTGSYVDFSTTPLDFLGKIDVIGIPFSGSTDTKIKRTMVEGANTLENDGDSIWADVEVVGLHLRSEGLVDLSFLDDSLGSAYLHFTINRDGAAGALPMPLADTTPLSIGQMKITYAPGNDGIRFWDGYWEDCYGTTADPEGVCSTLGISGGGPTNVDPNVNYPNDGGIWANMIAVIEGGDLYNPLDWVYLNLGGDSFPLVEVAPRIAISCEEGDSNNPDCKWLGDFNTVGVVKHKGPHPEVQAPEPSNILLLSAGLALFGWQHRRKSLA